MRRFLFPILLLCTVLTAILFFGGFLTGSQHLEFQDPYCRMKRIVDRRYGFSLHDENVSNVMCDYYFTDLKQKRNIFYWQPAPNSYSIERITGRRIEDTAIIPPVMQLKPEDEVPFLRFLPGNKIRIAVIRSLFSERITETTDAARKKNAALEKQEVDRVARILVWQRFDCNDPSQNPMRWWHENAAIFGLTPDGDPLPAPPMIQTGKR